MLTEGMTWRKHPFLADRVPTSQHIFSRFSFTIFKPSTSPFLCLLQSSECAVWGVCMIPLRMHCNLFSQVPIKDDVNLFLKYIPIM